ncbi:unnamed protein product, partial [Dovyalis caffra]
QCNCNKNKGLIPGARKRRAPNLRRDAKNKGLSQDPNVKLRTHSLPAKSQEHKRNTALTNHSLSVVLEEGDVRRVLVSKQTDLAFAATKLRTTSSVPMIRSFASLQVVTLSLNSPSFLRESSPSEAPTTRCRCMP